MLAWPPEPSPGPSMQLAPLLDVGKDISTEREMEPLGMLPEVGTAPWLWAGTLIGGGGGVARPPWAAPGAWGGAS